MLSIGIAHRTEATVVSFITSAAIGVPLAAAAGVICILRQNHSLFPSAGDLSPVSIVPARLPGGFLLLVHVPASARALEGGHCDEVAGADDLFLVLLHIRLFQCFQGKTIRAIAPRAGAIQRPLSSSSICHSAMSDSQSVVEDYREDVAHGDADPTERDHLDLKVKVLFHASATSVVMQKSISAASATLDS